ncbi:3-dehydroquinate synthase [Streptococcus equi subsp. zooepidemicus]|uniref:3-dehydroquinate synthase n=1 Tax=Streptococcus equi TaxID=1336 RepID=UPI001E5B3145|nr:3-dehydroquinate synthase [Streptococcus equi]MCD3401427.1 3-dehydroquinate synthase [Streptococcus equi subsp. zooepidemicus]
MTQTLQVKSRINDYPIIFTDDIFQPLNQFLAEKGDVKLLFITDQTVFDLYQPLFRRFQQDYDSYLHIAAPGGQSKSLEEVSRIYDRLIRANFSKKDVIVTVGGGVIGDLGGFVAATFYRGISYVQIPTTLLSQVDSSIGGKVGVHFKGLTNMIGSIYPPNQIIVSAKFLDTLSEREFACGISEMIKIGFIHDRKLFQQLLVFPKDRNQEQLRQMIFQAICHKKRVVEKDEFEGNLRMSLNFGHTLGHAIEALCHHELYRHGEAIAIGMVFEAKLAVQQQLLSQQDLEALQAAFEAYQLPTTLEAMSMTAEALMTVLKTDKKNSGQHIVLILPTTKGYVSFPIAKHDSRLLDWLRSLLDIA